VLKGHEALISGSTILHILVPGNWEPGDIDIVLPETYESSFESFLTVNGYSFDPSRQTALTQNYPQQASHPSTFRYRCFKNGSKKIDLCYVEKSFTPLAHIFTYHSTAVMNFYDGATVCCLFPEQTFARQFLRNSLNSGHPRVEASLKKLVSRGFSQKVGWVKDWFADSVTEDGGKILFQKLPTVWVQPVNL